MGKKKKTKAPTLEKSDIKSNKAHGSAANSDFSAIHPIWMRALPIALIALLGVLIYTNTLDVPFIFDDTQNIRDNQHIQLTQLTLQGLESAGFESPAKNRPVANISFALNHYLHGYALKGFHVVNIGIHILNAWLLFIFVRLTLRAPALNVKHGDIVWISLSAALLWLVHPLQTQSVTYIVQRMNSMAVFFYLGAFVLYIKARNHDNPAGRYTLYGIGIVSGILALGTKEIAFTLPFFIFLYEWFFYQDLSIKWMRQHIGVIATLFLLSTALVLIFTGGHPVDRILSDYNHREFTLDQRVLTQLRVVIYYLSLFFFPMPSRLSLDYDFPLSNSLVDPMTTLLCMVLIIALIGLAVVAARRERLVSFCVLWFFGNLVLESSVIALELVYEHRTYLPSMMFSFLMVWLYYRYVPNKKAGLMILAVVIAVFSIWTYQRNNMWQDEVSLWQGSVNRFPNKARIRNNLGIALSERGRIAEARPHFERALQLEPTYAQAHFNLANVLLIENELGPAIDHYKVAIRVKKDYAEAHYHLSHAYLAGGNDDQALMHLEKTIALKPAFAPAYFDLGRIKQKKGRPNEAMTYFSTAIEINPDYGDALYNMGNVLRRQGRDREAIEYYLRILELYPNSAPLHNNLAISLYNVGKREESIRHFRKSLQIDPGFERARDNLNKIISVK